MIILYKNTGDELLYGVIFLDQSVASFCYRDLHLQNTVDLVFIYNLIKYASSDKYYIL